MDFSLNIASGYDGGVHEIVRLFFPGTHIVYIPGQAETEVKLEVEYTPEGVSLQASLHGGLEGQMKDILRGSEEIANAKREVRRLIFLLLQEVTGRQPSPYGILTGVRPVKLVHNLLDRGLSPSSVAGELQENFLVNRGKACLLMEVALRNRPYLLNREDVGKQVGVYIGIPYCPSRCFYCSFPGYDVHHRPGVDEFLEGLIEEINRVGKVMSDLATGVDSVYIGGGTPTVLLPAQWNRLLDVVNEHLLKDQRVEFTVEAGRPDSLNREVLDLLLRSGVNRICINPQTMKDQTLEIIGRRHTAEMTLQAFQNARDAGFGNINMDLIMGLPGEGPNEFWESLARVMEMRPEGITIHHLARKRGSGWEKMEELGGSMGEVQGSEPAYQMLREQGYLPYYLYRQKRMAGNLENVGFSLPGFFNLYNIRMIEERQTIIGFGGGSASKFVNPGDLTLSSHHHPKDPASYLSSLERLINGQVDKLSALS